MKLRPDSHPWPLFVLWLSRIARYVPSPAEQKSPQGCDPCGCHFFETGSKFLGKDIGLENQACLSSEPVGHTKRQNGRLMNSESMTKTPPTAITIHEADLTMKPVKIS